MFLRAAAGVLVLALALRAQAPPMFSPWYGEALRDVLSLEAADALRLERQLAKNPGDSPTRLKLMAYHHRADRAQRDLPKRVRHVLWLIENQPQSEILHSYVSLFRQGELSGDEHQRAVALWRAAVKGHSGDASILWNTAWFFQPLDRKLHLDYMEATAAADPNHPFALRPLAHLYAAEIVSAGPFAARAQTALDASTNVWVLGNAAHMFQSLYNQSLQSGKRNSRWAELAERCFLRAKAIDPKLDRNAILPQLDMQAVARTWEQQKREQADMEAQFRQAAGQIRRLPVDAFPQLPASVAGVLRQRKCTVPQPYLDGPPRNVIRGQFYAKGEAGWAVLCSVNNSSSLLVFRNDSDTTPETLSTSEDAGYLQGVGEGRIGYSHEIRTVGRDYIMTHYRAYGGPEPPPIDHAGIDDAFLEKASGVWYFYRGKWLGLAGAD